ncbi:MAG: T9SS type A sorting domain-containing protein [candidate division WOR-3 bacterium]|nr:MAG: T9SS type A sorting domain-containing protein [candidate division WOR-3 bacterium]UCF05598.1 MAG: T9SS type A sorting domain-containing protein [bacterium]
MKFVIGCIITILSMILTVNDLPARPQSVQDRVWFTPNVASVDMLELFTAPERWTLARARIDVFKFYSGQVGSEGWSCNVNPALTCGMNYLDNLVNVQAFSMLGQWGIDIAIESFFAGPVMSVDPVECSTSQHVYSLTLNGSINVIQNVQANGGIVRYLAMDEPIRQWLPAYFYIYTGQTDPRPCLVDSLGILADHVSAYILQMQSWYPSIPIGQIDLYPEVSVDQFKEWIIALEARGVSLPFLHLDVNGPRIDQYISFGIDIDLAADLAELKSFLEARGIAFGIIFTDIYWNSQAWEVGEYDDQTYYDGTMDWFNLVRAMNVEPDHNIFQSWVLPYYTTGPGPKEIPINLPEDDPSIYSHTRLINDALDIIVGVDSGPSSGLPAGSWLHQNHPNPFNPRTSIIYELPKSSRVILRIYDVRGIEVQTLVNAFQKPGKYSVYFETHDLPAGVYFCKLQVGDRFIETKKMILLK